MVPIEMRLRRGRAPRWSITADIPQRSYPRRILRIGRAVIPSTAAACTQLSCPSIALMMTSRRVIVRASRHTRRSIFSIVRPYPTGRTSLNVYAPDISDVYDTYFGRTYY
jgi:hypothetical protein